MTSPAGTGAPRVRSDRPSPGRGELEYAAEVAPGVTVRWDPVAPHRCVDLDVTAEAGSPDVAARLAEVDREPWLRLAAITVLDRRLYLPLNRSLLDAERAAAQFAAAATLSGGEPVHEFLVRSALVGARRAAAGVVNGLERLTADDRPPALLAAFAPVVRCYAALSGEVRELDVALAAVTEAWHRLTSAAAPAAPRRRAVAPPVPAGSTQPGVDQIDPRTVPARVLRLGPSLDTAEISVNPVRRNNGPALRVRVAAFPDAPSGHDGVDVGVRLVDRRSGEVRGYGVLGAPTHRHPSVRGGGGDRHFEGIVALPAALAVSDVRVDLFGVAETPPPRLGAAELRRSRRATLFLAGWRALVADVRLWGVRTAPTARINALLRHIADDQPSDRGEPLWSGGPSRANLLCLAELSDRTLTGLLSAVPSRARGRRGAAIPGDDGGAAAVVACVSGPGDLLVAEIAAAHERVRWTHTG